MKAIWMSRKTLAEIFGYSVSHMSNILRGVRNEIDRGRYPQYCHSGRRYDFYAVTDYFTYRERLERDEFRKYVPPFDANKVSEWPLVKVLMKGGETDG